MELKKHASGEFIFRNPKWTTKDTIEVEVEHDEYGWIPFNASPDDDVDYGRELFDLLSTKYSAQVVVCPQSAYDEEAVAEALLRRAQELKASDWTQLPDVPQATKDLWTPYRQALRDITDQPGYPHNIDWPTPPA
jgi:hypothetical protein